MQTWHQQNVAPSWKEARGGRIIIWRCREIFEADNYKTLPATGAPRSLSPENCILAFPWLWGMVIIEVLVTERRLASQVYCLLLHPGKIHAAHISLYIVLCTVYGSPPSWHRPAEKDDTCTETHRHTTHWFPHHFHIGFDAVMAENWELATDDMHKAQTERRSSDREWKRLSFLFCLGAPRLVNITKPRSRLSDRERRGEGWGGVTVLPKIA